MLEVALKNAHIAFISAPLASHVNPILPLLTVLVRRGHRVTYATSEPFVDRVASTGADVIEYKYGASTFKNADEYSFCRIANNTIAGVSGFYERHRPDVLAYDFVALAGRLLAHRLNVPAFMTASDFAFSSEYIEEQISIPKLREGALAASDAADKFLSSNGVETRGFLFKRTRLNLFLFPKEFEPSISALDQSCIHAGRCVGEQAGFGEWKRPDSSVAPIILIAPSRSYSQGIEYYRMCIAALSNLRCHIVLSIDDSEDASALRPLPDHVEIVQRVSHTRILPYADLVIGMAGTVTTAEALYHGVPVIMNSCGATELEWSADILMRLGIGVHIPNAEMSAESLRAAVHHTLGSSSIFGNVSRLQHSIRRQPGAEEAANAIDEFIASVAIRPT